MLAGILLNLKLPGAGGAEETKPRIDVAKRAAIEDREITEFITNLPINWTFNG